VIGDRALGRDARVVTVLAQALMLGLKQSGMGNCGKHFPGHGFVKADSHLEIPVDGRSLKVILAEDAAPYGWLSSSLEAVMPAHVIYPKVDRRPAGFSERWLQDILRHQLGFTGAIFSDDLSMEAARFIDGQRVSFTEAALAALGAGADMVLLCNQSIVDGGAPIDAAIDDLSRAVLQGDWAPSPASETRRLALVPAADAVEWDELMVSDRYMHALSLLP
jgi:beta-N-acetylhexosaminidase